MRPTIRKKNPVTREPVRFPHCIDELSMAVVLNQPVRAGTVHAARHKPVLSLKGGIPADEFGQSALVADAQKRRPHNDPVAAPRPCAAAGTRLDLPSLPNHSVCVPPPRDTPTNSPPPPPPPSPTHPPPPPPAYHSSH